MTATAVMDDILRMPWVLLDYQNWLNERPDSPDTDYLFAHSRIRFAPEDHDRLVISDSVKVVTVPGGFAIQVSEQLPPISITAQQKGHVEAIISALDKQPLLIELPLCSGAPASTCDWLMHVGFGKFIFALAALEELEVCVSAAEIVRFPASPYEIDRNYWNNVGQLSMSVSDSLSAPFDQTSFVRWLRACHVQLLLGKNLDTYYCPSSPITRHRVAPGALYTRNTRTINSTAGIFIVDGPRINASAVGGARYHQLLCRSLKIEPTRADELDFHDHEEHWGKLVRARARMDKQEGDWFLPPRPIRDAHWEILRDAWSHATNAIKSGDQPAGIAQLGRFHWYFIHLHPFACANQSLAFTLINCVLNRLNGSGIPQLVLDHLALRLNVADYATVFGRAVAAWSTSASGALARHKERMQKRRSLDMIVAKVDRAIDENEALSVTSGDATGAQLALLVER